MCATGPPKDVRPKAQGDKQDFQQARDSHSRAIVAELTGRVSTSQAFSALTLAEGLCFHCGVKARRLAQCNAEGVDMEVLRKPVAVFLMLGALAVLVHFWLSPFYPDSWDVGTIWEVLDVIMAVGIVVTLAYTFSYKRSVGSDDSTLAHICAYTAFYAAAVLAVLFFWNWFDDLTKAAGEQSQTRLNYWVAINALYIVFTGTVGWHLWRK